MKIRVVSEGSQEVFYWLDLKCQVSGQKMLRLVKKIDDSLKKYKVKLNDDCQNHLSEIDFLTVPKLKDGNEYVTSENIAQEVPARV